MNQISWESLFKDDPKLIDQYISRLEKFDRIFSETTLNYEKQSKRFSDASKSLLSNLIEIDKQIKKGVATEKQIKSVGNLAKAYQITDIQSKKYAIQLESLKIKEEKLNETRVKANKVKESQQKINNASEESIVKLKKRVKELRNDFELLTKEERENSEQGKELTRKIGELNKEIKDSKTPLKDSERIAGELQGSYNQLARQTSLLVRELKLLPNGFEKGNKAGEELIKQIAKNQSQLKDFDAQIGNFQRNVGNYSSALDGVGGGLGTLSGIANAAVTGGVAGLTSALTGALVQGAVNLAEELKITNKQLLDTKNTLQITGDESVKTASKLSGISKFYGEDFTEILLGANAVIKRFGTDSEEVLDTINKSLAAGANVNGEYLDSLKEYTTIVADTKISFEDYNDILFLSSKSGGYADKAIDGYKEMAETFDNLNQKQKDAIKLLPNAEKVTAAISSKDISTAVSLTAQGLKSMKEQGLSITAISKELGASPLLDGGGAALETLSAFKEFNIELTKGQKVQYEWAKATQETQQELFELTELTTGTSSEFGLMLEKSKAFGLYLINNLVKYFIKLKNELGLLADEFKPIIAYIKEFFEGGKETESVFSQLFDTLFSLVGEINFIGFLKIMVAGFHAIKQGVESTKDSILDFSNGFDSLINLDFEGAKKSFTKGFSDIASDSKKAFTEKYNSLTFDTKTLDVDASKKEAEKQAENAKKVQIEKQKEANKKSIELAKKNLEAIHQIDKLLIERKLNDNEKLLENEKLTYDERIKIVKENASIRQELNELVLQNDLNKSSLTSKEKVLIQEQYVDKVIESEDKLFSEIKAIKEKAFLETESNISNFSQDIQSEHESITAQIDKELQERVELNLSALEKEEEDLKESEEKKKEIRQAGLDFGKEMINSGFDLYSNSLDNQSQRLEEKKEKELELEGLTEEQKKLISEKYDKEQAKIKRKQAIAERASSLFNVAINTAVAISKAVAASPLTFGLPFSAFAAATGAVQAGLILSKPIPKFRKGKRLLKRTDGVTGLKGMDSDGLAIEAHEDERIMQSEYAKQIPNYSDSEIVRLVREREIYDKVNDRALHSHEENAHKIKKSNNSETTKTVNNKETKDINISITGSGTKVSENGSTIDYANNRFKFKRTF